MWICVLQDFGADSDKPTWLYCNYRILDSLGDYMSGPGPQWGKKEMVKRYVNRFGEKKFHGGKDLKSSQHYPLGFGVAVRKTFLKHKPEIQTRMALLRSTALKKSCPRCPLDLWPDADIDGALVAAFGL